MQKMKDGLMRSTSTKAKIVADEPARQPRAVTHSAIAHAESATRSRVAFFFAYGVCVLAASKVIA
jgi:hypothetical protein